MLEQRHAGALIDLFREQCQAQHSEDTADLRRDNEQVGLDRGEFELAQGERKVGSGRAGRDAEGESAEKRKAVGIHMTK